MTPLCLTVASQADYDRAHQDHFLPRPALLSRSFRETQDVIVGDVKVRTQNLVTTVTVNQVISFDDKFSVQLILSTSLADENYVVTGAYEQRARTLELKTPVSFNDLEKYLAVDRYSWSMMNNEEEEEESDI